MKLKISEIEDKGILEKERIVLNVVEDDDVGRYLILKSKTIGTGKFSAARISDIYWFQDKPIKKGDLVVLYTKVGTYKLSLNEKGNTSHFFYWNKETALFKEPNDTAVLLHTDEWKGS